MAKHVMKIDNCAISLKESYAGDLAE